MGVGSHESQNRGGFRILIRSYALENAEGNPICPFYHLDCGHKFISGHLLLVLFLETNGNEREIDVCRQYGVPLAVSCRLLTILCWWSYNWYYSEPCFSLISLKLLIPALTTIPYHYTSGTVYVGVLHIGRFEFCSIIHVGGYDAQYLTHYLWIRHLHLGGLHTIESTPLWQIITNCDPLVTRSARCLSTEPALYFWWSWWHWRREENLAPDMTLSFLPTSR